MPQSLPMEPCPHERGPSTTVCLHCRRDARLAAQARRQRVLLRGGAVALVFVTLGAGGLLGASAIRERNATRTADTDHSSAPSVRVASTDANQSKAAGKRMGTADDAPLHSVLPLGMSTLSEGVVAARTDSDIVVSFDAPMIRTRMPEKFERFVRTTLPAVYGPAVDSALAKLPEGGIARQGDLLNELPIRGVRIPVKGAWTITLYPETRPGFDGPLVIRYRVSVVKA